MARPRIENPIMEGDISKLYFLGFGGQFYKYEAARILGKTKKMAKGEVPDSTYITSLLKKYSDYEPKLFDTKEILENNRRKVLYLSRVEPFIDQINRDLKSTGQPPLSDTEEEKLKQYLDNDFRKEIKFLTDLLIEKGSFRQPINAYRQLIEFLCIRVRMTFLAADGYFQGLINARNIDVFKEVISQFSPLIKEPVPLSKELLKKLYNLPTCTQLPSIMLLDSLFSNIPLSRIKEEKEKELE